MKKLLAFLILTAPCFAQAPKDVVLTPPPACDGWYGVQIGNNCVLTFRFAPIAGLTCTVEPNNTPGQSPVQVVCTYPAPPAPQIDKKAAK